MKTKVCSKCGIDKNINDYYKKKRNINGYDTRCKICFNINRSEYRKKNKEKISKRCKHYYLENKEKISKINKENHIRNKIKIDEYLKNWKKNNKDKIKKTSKEYEINNREKINKKRIEKYHIDEQFNLIVKTRRRIYKMLKSQESSKKYKTIKLLGCSFDFYKQYLESLFTEGMTWELLRAGKIHIDHIKPCSSFNLTKPEEQKKCFHYTNTQPLWAKDNLSKGNKIA